MASRQENDIGFPKLDILTLLFESELCLAKEDTPVHAEARDPTRAITKKHARDLTKQFAYYLRKHYGIGANGPDNDVVAVVTTGQSATACLFFGVIAAGGVYSAASPASTPSELARQLKDGKVKVLVCSRELVKVSQEAAKLVGLPKENITILESYPEVKLANLTGDKVCDFRGSLDWKRITNPRELETSKIAILYSSGTTGLPKGVLISHTNLVAEVYSTGSLLRPTFDKWAQEGRPFFGKTLGHLPTNHIAGLYGYFVDQMYGGGTVYWMPTFNFDDFLKYSGALKITYFFTVPPIFLAIAKHPGVRGQFDHVRRSVGGAAPFSDDLQRASAARMRADRVTQTWGLSETTGSATATPLEKEFTMGSVGEALPNVHIRIVDEDEKDVPEGSPGEAWVKGPNVTQGYYNNPEANAASFTKDGWFKTGDVLVKKGDEYFVVDRKKELIKYKGNQVAPAELEGLLTAIPEVVDAAVVGINQNHTEVPRAYVVLAPAARGKVTESDIADMIKAKVSSYKRLRGGVKFVEAIPRSPSGKILRREVRDMYKEETRTSKL